MGGMREARQLLADQRTDKQPFAVGTQFGDPFTPMVSTHKSRIRAMKTLVVIGTLTFPITSPETIRIALAEHQYWQKKQWVHPKTVPLHTMAFINERERADVLPCFGFAVCQPTSARNSSGNRYEVNARQVSPDACRGFQIMYSRPLPITWATLMIDTHGIGNQRAYYR